MAGRFPWNHSQIRRRPERFFEFLAYAPGCATCVALQHVSARIPALFWSAPRVGEKKIPAVAVRANARAVTHALTRTAARRDAGVLEWRRVGRPTQKSTPLRREYAMAARGRLSVRDFSDIWTYCSWSEKCQAVDTLIVGMSKTQGGASPEARTLRGPKKTAVPSFVFDLAIHPGEHSITCNTAQA